MAVFQIDHHPLPLPIPPTIDWITSMYSISHCSIFIFLFLFKNHTFMRFEHMTSSIRMEKSLLAQTLFPWKV